MTFILKDRVHETTTTTGTGALTLAGAASNEQAFSDVCSIGDTFWYAIVHSGVAWETGIGTYSAANTLTRTTVLESSNSGSAVSFAAGTKDVFITLPASKSNNPVSLDVDEDVTVGGDISVDGDTTVGGDLAVTGGITGNTTAQERQNSALDRIDIAKDRGSYRHRLKAFADGYEDESGINTTDSSNYTLDDTNGLVEPTTTAGVDNAPTMTSNTVPSPYVISASHEDTSSPNGPAWKAFDGTDSGWRDSTSANPWIKIDFGEATEIGSYSIKIRVDTADVFNEPTAWTMQGSSTGAFAGEETDIDSQSGISWSSVGQTKTFTLSSAQTFRYYRWLITAFNDSVLIITEIRTFAPPTTNNMTVVTTAQTADSSVSNARVLIAYGDTDSPTLNTDLTVEVTCDGGTNWTTATLTSVGAALHQVAETADTACTAGTSYAARIKTLNGKDVSVYGVSLTVH